MNDLYVEAINRTTCLAVLNDGQVIPITNWYENGEDGEPDDATSCVCGPCNRGKWYVVDLSEMDGVMQ
jgi:hypothetical protein